MSRAQAGSPGLEREQHYWQLGQRIAGLDEAGRGAWAGPVVAAAVVLPPRPRSWQQLLAGVDDSKKLSSRQRQALEPVIRAVAEVGVGIASAAEIDAAGIVPATMQAMQRALAHLPQAPDILLIDYIPRALGDWPQERIKHGDSMSLAIAAASIVAKVARDQWMVEEAELRWPGYGFARHKGYGTAQHRVALDRLGPTSIHRRSWAPLLQPRLL